MVIPTRNRPEFLADAVGSVVGQDYRDFEILVVDDASDSVSVNAEVLARFAGPIRHIVRSERGGPSAARNAGIRASDSEYIAFLDDDDIWLPSKLSRQIQLFESNPRGHHRLGFVYCAHQWIDFQTGRTQPRRLPRIARPEDLFRSRYNIIQTVLLRRVCVEEVGGFHEGIAFQENLEFLLRVLRRFQADCVDDLLVICRTHRGPRTGDDLVAIVHGYRTTLATARAAGIDPSVLHGDYFRLARTLMAVGAMREARQALALAISFGPPVRFPRYAVFWWLSYVAPVVNPSLPGNFARRVARWLPSRTDWR